MPMNPRTVAETHNQIIAMITDHSEGDVDLAKLLTLSVGRVLSKAAKAGEDWTILYDRNAVAHIADWLKASLVNNASWLANVDSAGNPKKLRKFSSITQITQEADKAMAIAIQQQGQAALVEGDEELYATTSDGFDLVRLKTPAALDRESAAMQHCVGQGAYDGWLDMSGYMILSMRDRHGKAHATIEIENGRVLQIQGKQNQMPRRDYFESLMHYFVRENGGHFDVAMALSNLGVTMSASGEITRIHEMPDDFETYSHLDLTEFRHVRIPKNLIVNGHLEVSETPSISIGPINVRGNLHLKSNSSIEKLEGEVLIGSSLFLSSVDNIHSLPVGLKIPGTLRIYYCDNLLDLPSGMEVGKLDLQHSNIKKLPDDIKIAQHLNISRTEIDVNELPPHLQDDLVVRTSSFERERTLAQIRRAATRSHKII